MSDTINTAGNMPKDVIPLWDQIRGTVVELHWVWKFHVDLCGNESHVALMRKILLWPFMLIRKSALSYITMGIGRVLDIAKSCKHTNLSFAHLLEAIKPYSTPEFEAKMASMLRDANVHCKLLRLWRDKRFGHADKDHVLGTGTERLPEVEQEVFEKALALLHDLLYEIHAHFNPGVTLDFPDHIGDADRLMKYIRGGYDAESAEIASLFP